MICRTCGCSVDPGDRCRCEDTAIIWGLILVFALVGWVVVFS